MRFFMKAENSEFLSLKMHLQSTFPFRGKNDNPLSLYMFEPCFFLSLFSQEQICVIFAKFN